MNTTRYFSLACLLSVTLTLPALASTIVIQPVNGEQVPSPFNLTMSADTCSSRPVTHVGYSLDSGVNTPIFSGQRMDGPVSSPDGWHIVHIKAWNDWGEVCVTDVSVDVVNPAASVVPAYAVKVSDIQTLGSWFHVHDGGTPGASSGAMSLVNSPSLSGTARLFTTSFTYFGGERYSIHFGDDKLAENFLYDLWVYIAGSSSGLSNLEFDLNQTLPNGETVIMGFQCDSWINRWDYAVNGGSPVKFWDTWLHSYAPCNVHTWATNQWHHVQIYFSHNESGWVTYHSVWLDGVEQNLNITAFSGFALGWGPSNMANFQIDGSAAGTTSATVSLDDMTVYRW